MRWELTPKKRKFEGNDPYVQWRLGAGANQHQTSENKDGPRRPVIVRLEQGVEAHQFAVQQAWRSLVSVPAFYERPVQGLEDARWCTSIVKPGFFEFLDRGGALRNWISRIAVLPPTTPQHGRMSTSIVGDGKKPFDYPKEGTVVMGIIDYGIAFAHERFRRTKCKSRIEYLWVQDAPDGTAHQQPKRQETEKRLPYGREIQANHINHWLFSSELAGEDLIYRQAAESLGMRWLRSVSRRAAHGTHVADLACGYDLTDEHSDKRERRPIVCVQLPEATTADTSGENLDAYALDGIRYILDRADAIAQRSGRAHLPVVINFSYGSVAGPHDGTSPLEAAIDELINLRNQAACGPLEVVLPSGNSHLGRLHAKFDFSSSEKRKGEQHRSTYESRTDSTLAGAARRPNAELPGDLAAAK